MAVLSDDALTLAEWAKRLDPSGRIPVIAELLSQTNEILMDILFAKANGTTYHREVIRVGLPTVYWRAINQGVPSSASKTRQVDEAMGSLEAYSKPDIGLIEMAEDKEATRLSEDVAFLEAMNQEATATWFYGNPTTNPNKPLGLAARYSNYTSAGNSQNVINAGGATALGQTSVWLIGFGRQTVFGTFPKGSIAGLQSDDMGKQLIQQNDGTNDTYYTALVTHYVWKFGIVVKDWRYIVRILNIDVAALIAQTSSSVGDPAFSGALVKLMARALNRIPRGSMAKLRWYCNRTVFSGLQIMAMDKSSAALSIREATTQFGEANAMTSFLGVPLRLCDAILDTEAVVAA